MEKSGALTKSYYQFHPYLYRENNEVHHELLMQNINSQNEGKYSVQQLQFTVHMKSETGQGTLKPLRVNRKQQSSPRKTISPSWYGFHILILILHITVLLNKEKEERFHQSQTIMLQSTSIFIELCYVQSMLCSQCAVST